MDEDFEIIRESFSKFDEFPMMDDKSWDKFKQDSVVVLQAGGESSRFRHIMGGNKEVQKSAFKLPNGDTMLEMTVRLYRDAGLTNFVILICFAAESVKKLLGNGSKLGVSIKYSQEPWLMGSGGAIYYAIDQGIIPKNKHIFVHNPDDLVVDFPEFPRYVASAHLESVKRGNLMTAVVFPTRDYPGSAMKIIGSQVKAVEYHPQLPIPIHLGATVISPDFIPMFADHVDLKKKGKTEFEGLFFPMLAKEDKLGAVDFPKGEWIPVNDDKMYGKLLDYIGKSKVVK